MKIEVSFSLEQEVERVTQTVAKLVWYREHYGMRNSRLPQGISERSTREEIASAVAAEFAPTIYEDFKVYVQENSSKAIEDIKRLKEIPAFKFRESYLLILTKYGSGGSYDSDTGEVIANIAFRPKEDIVGVVVHEIVHIGIQHLIDAYKISHWRKERLVDLIVDRYFPGLRRLQIIKEDVSAVDDAFKRFFPDIEAIAKAI